MSIIIISLLLFFLLLLTQMKKEGGLQRMRRYSFRFVVGVFLLYIVHIFIGQYGMDISINLFSIGMVVFLGFPGMLTVVFLSFLK